MALKLHLVDLDAELVQAWREEFSAFPEVDIQNGDILSVAHHCIVSPANSHGFMDGGIDDQYRRFFGAAVEELVRDAILRTPEEKLPVGTSLAVATKHPRIPWLLLAPTMEMPEPVPSSHSGRAMRAILRATGRMRELRGDIFCPGLGTGVGQVPPQQAAEEMADAYEWWLDNPSSHHDA